MRVADFHRLTCVSRTDFLGCMTCSWLRSSMRACWEELVNVDRWVELVHVNCWALSVDLPELN